MVDGTYQADRHNRHTKLLREPETAVLKLVHMAVARALRLRKNNERDAAVDRLLGHTPKALQVLGAADIGYWHIPEALHQPTVHGNVEMGFQFPAAHQLRNRAV